MSASEPMFNHAGCLDLGARRAHHGVARSVASLAGHVVVDEGYGASARANVSAVMGECFMPNRAAFRLMSLLSVVACSCAVTAARADDMLWTRVGYPWAARHIAVCSNPPVETVYALNNDHSLYSNTHGGDDTHWVYRATFQNIVDIECSGAQLFGIDATRHLLQLRWVPGYPPYSVGHYVWDPVGYPYAARDLAGFTMSTDGVFHFFAVNDDNSFLRNDADGNDAAWSRIGVPGARILGISGQDGGYATWAIADVSPGPGDNRLRILYPGSGSVFVQHLPDWGTPPSNIQSVAGYDWCLYALDADWRLYHGCYDIP
jgi:hypothetical protein